MATFWDQQRNADLTGLEAGLNFVAKYSWRGIIGIFLTTGTVILRPALFDWGQPLLCWFLVGFIFSGSVLLTYVGSGVYPWAARYAHGVRAKHIGKKYLHNLNPSEKEHCKWFLETDGRPLNHNVSNGGIESLLSNGILIRPGVQWFTGDGMFDFNIQPWALDYLRAHPKLVEPAAQQSQKKPTVSPSHRLKRWKSVVTVVTLTLPFLYLAFIVTDRLGVSDRWTELNLVENVSDRFQLSYANDASRVVLAGEKEWKPVLKLLHTYSTAHFRVGTEPQVFARWQASLSTRVPTDGPIISEWTAPSTPIAVLYCDCGPSSRKQIRQEDVLVVGTIGELKEWISKAKDRRKFLMLNVFLGTFGPLLAVALFLLSKRIEAVN